MTPQGSVLFIDAYDSFAENIAALLQQQLLVQVTLIRIDCDVLKQFNQSQEEFFSNFDAIVLGPGPGNPYNDADVGLFTQVWAHAARENVPVLGICLGFQSLCTQYGLSVVPMRLPCHGHAKRIHHADQDIFNNSGTILATNYNSLGVRLRDFKQDSTLSRPSSFGSVDSLSSSQSLRSATSVFSIALHDGPRPRIVDKLELLAWDNDDWVMGVRHKLLPFHGFQFHPESCKSNTACQTLLKQWWENARKHNQLYRAPLAPRREKGEQRGGSTLPSRQGNAYRSLEEALAKLSSSHGGQVAREAVQLPAGSDNIATLCQQLSPSNAVVMLESTKRGRYSMYAFPDTSSFQIVYKDGECHLIRDCSLINRFRLSREEMVDILEAFLCNQSVHASESKVPFTGGFMGFMSYEFGTASLDLNVSLSDGPPPKTPEISLLWVDRSIVFDHHTAVAHVQSIRGADEVWVKEMMQIIQSIPPPQGQPDEESLRELLSSAQFTLPDHDKYISQIRACQSELLAGNSYEICLTTEATITTPAGPENSWLLYRNIQRHNPVPFASYIRLNSTTILSSSPEQFLSWSREGGTIDMVPMKGTVKKTPDMTLARATEFLSSAKESAENLMIADLIRHDLYSTVGRDAKVEVVKLCDIVETETVFSLVSHIRAHVPSSPDASRVSEMTRYGIKALTRTLPPGSMTGAPKKRSCEILHGLEARDRGVYSGAIGFMDVCGNGAWSVCIRTAFSNDDDDEEDDKRQQAPHDLDSAFSRRQKWRVGAGGAITVLSDEEQEWEEMMTKLESVMRGFRT